MLTAKNKKVTNELPYTLKYGNYEHGPFGPTARIPVENTSIFDNLIGETEPAETVNRQLTADYTPSRPPICVHPRLSAA
jgi:hypothetical protein